jgi:hypothetical protein
MRKSVLWVCMAALCLTLLSVPALAQNNSMQGPPKVLSIYREEVKPGKDLAHNQHEIAWTQALKKAKYQQTMLAMTSVTGPSEAWFLKGFDSFAGLEKDNQASEKDPALAAVSAAFVPKESEYLNEGRELTARYRPEISYKPNINVGEYRYFSIAIARFRLGENADDFYKALNGAREKAGLDTHMAVYQVSSGAAAGTYISFTPIKSMSEWDAPPNPALDAAYKEIGFGQLVGKYIMNVEFRLFSFSAPMSIPTQAMIAANPGFWSPKPAMANKAAASGDVMPAAKKETKK